MVVVQLPSHIQLFVTPWTTAYQASLSFSVSWSLLKFTSIESEMLSNHLILFRSGGQSIGASASVLLMNIQGLFPLGLTDLFSLLSSGLSRD